MPEAGRVRILVVEDHEPMAQAIADVLRQAGYEPRIATDGAEAERIVAGEAPPDLVLLDAMLPHKDGWELVALMRAAPAWREVPVVMLTARSGEEDVVRGLGAGANDYLAKPFRAQELLARVRSQLRGRS